MHNYVQSKMSTTCTELRLMQTQVACAELPLAFTHILAASAKPPKQLLLRGFHGCRVSIEPSYSIEWKEVERRRDGEREDVL